MGTGREGDRHRHADPGPWTYYCSVPTHRALGMEGKLTITG